MESLLGSLALVFVATVECDVGEIPVGDARRPGRVGKLVDLVDGKRSDRSEM